MSRNPFGSPLLLGLEGLEVLLERASRTSGDGYPPYNIEQMGPNRLRITLAVAGFTSADLAVTVEGRELTIRGQRDGGAERVYLHRGIAARKFHKSFVLADPWQVNSAELAHGLLHIDVVRPEPNISARTISILDREAGANQAEKIETKTSAKPGKGAPG